MRKDWDTEESVDGSIQQIHLIFQRQEQDKDKIIHDAHISIKTYVRVDGLEEKLFVLTKNYG